MRDPGPCPLCLAAGRLPCGAVPGGWQLTLLGGAPLPMAVHARWPVILLLGFVSSLRLRRATAAAAATAAIEPADDSSVVEGIGDPLWLRYPRVSDRARLAEYRALLADGSGGGSAVIVCGGCASDAVTQEQLNAAAEELQSGMRGLLGLAYKVVVSKHAAPAGTKLVMAVVAAAADVLGDEGYRVVHEDAMDVLRVEAGSSSGLLYGMFRLLSTMQTKQPLRQDYTSVPAMSLRVLNLWDNLAGDIERGYAGNSLLWPYAMYRDDVQLPRRELFVTACNASDVFQQWDFPPPGTEGLIVNVGSAECLAAGPHQNPMQTTPNASACAVWRLNANRSVSAKGEGRCVDVQNGEGPDVDIWHCKRPYGGSDPHALADVRKQQFEYARATKQWMTMPGTHAPGVVRRLRPKFANAPRLI